MWGVVGAEVRRAESGVARHGTPSESRVAPCVPSPKISQQYVIRIMQMQQATLQLRPLDVVCINNVAGTMTSLNVFRAVLGTTSTVLAWNPT